MGGTGDIYMIPGLGADGRLFCELEKEGLRVRVLEFIKPMKNETLAEYAARMAEGIDTSRPFVVGGVSMGGIVATEIGWILEPERVVVISSVKNSREFPFYFKLGRWLPLHKLLTGDKMRRYAPRERRMRAEYRKVLDDMRMDADPWFVEWAVNALVRWRRKETHPRVVHIHGTRDMLLPSCFLGKQVKVRGGKHGMVLTHAREVAEAVRRALEG